MSVLKLSVDRVRQPKQYSLECTAEGKQGRHTIQYNIKLVTRHMLLECYS